MMSARQDQFFLARFFYHEAGLTQVGVGECFGGAAGSEMGDAPGEVFEAFEIAPE